MILDIKRLIKLAILLVGIPLASLVGYSLYYLHSPLEREAKTVTIEIPKGASFRKASVILQEAGLNRHPLIFHLLGLVRGVTGKIRAGEYELSSNMTPREIISKLVRGEVRAFMITIPEDYTARDIAARLSSYKLVDEAEFLSLVNDREFLKDLGIEGLSAEGFLFPDTYKLDRTMGAREIIRIMVGQFWKSVNPLMVAQAERMGLTLVEWVTLASIVGKETSVAQEKPLVAAVFYNRLKKGMRLQSDPTAVYNLDNFSGKIRRRHLKNESPHNTYLIEALPPTPIGNPGLDSLQAALNPAQVDYLYFVSKKDGTHHFSSTLKDHNQAVWKYQIMKKE